MDAKYFNEMLGDFDNFFSAIGGFVALVQLISKLLDQVSPYVHHFQTYMRLEFIYANYYTRCYFYQITTKREDLNYMISQIVIFYHNNKIMREAIRRKDLSYALHNQLPRANSHAIKIILLSELEIKKRVGRNF